MKSSTKYRILGIITLVPWLPFVAVDVAAHCVSRIGCLLILWADWVQNHLPDLPKWWPYHKAHYRALMADWEEYAAREDADPKVLAGRPKWQSYEEYQASKSRIKNHRFEASNG